MPAFASVAEHLWIIILPPGADRIDICRRKMIGSLPGHSLGWI